MPPAQLELPVSVRGLTKRYGATSVVRDVTFDLRRGEVFALLGPNGAGKTTTVDMLTGVRRRTSGEIRVLGRDPAEDPREWRARIGVVPQSTGAYADLTVGEVIGHFAAMYPAPLPVGQVLEMVGLGAHRRRQALSLSGGQQRRLDVAVGIVGDPELIFLDEPTTGLDPVARREAWELVRYFAERGRTTLLTTHYLDEAEELAQRAGVIIGGELVACGPPAELGGRAETLTHVSFRRPEPLRLSPLPPLPPGTLRDSDEGPLVALRTPAPSRALAALLDWAQRSDVGELPQLRVHRPTLEETYLALLARHGAGRPTGSEGADEAEEAVAV